MGDELLPYYNDELSYIRDLATEFAKDHPKIAGRLRISPDAIEDPHVARLIEAFAYLNARIRFKLDDDFPELTDALLGVLYPHYLAPIPSMSIIQLRAAADLTAPYLLKQGVEVETEPIDGEPCRFRTCYPVTLWPLQVDAASVSGSALGAPSISALSEVASVLKLTLSCVSEQLALSELGPESLRFYLRGQGQYVFPLYELLFNDLIGVAVAEPGLAVARALLPPSSVTPVGFERNEGMLPYPPQAFIGYRLLTEFFAFPQKFLFFDLTGLAGALAGSGSRVEVYFYFRRNVAELEQKVDASTFALGCTPMVNLYRKRAEPIQLDQALAEYRVVPDARRPKASEVYSVDSVVATGPDGAKATYAPFFGTTHGTAQDDQRQYWKVARRPAPSGNPGSEVFLSVVDLELNPSAPAKWVAHLETTCLNRDLPARLPFGGGEPRLRLAEGVAAIERVECLTAPTRTLRPPTGHGGMWRLISHLTLNHLSITEHDQGAAALREILKLYDFRESAETRAMIEGVVSVDSRQVIARVPGLGGGALVRGIEVNLELDPKRFAGSGAFLLASVLERFLALYCTVNSFTRLVATLRGRDGVLRKWQPRAGEKTLL
jgi:type VI secretion system protein ImpG